MTSRSPRNHPTTRPNTRPWKRISALVVATAASFAPHLGSGAQAAGFGGDDAPLERVLPGPAAQSPPKQWYDDDTGLGPALRPSPIKDDFNAHSAAQPVPERPAIESSPGARAADVGRSPVDSIFPDAIPDQSTTKPHTSDKPQTARGPSGSGFPNFGESLKRPAGYRLGQVSPVPAPAAAPEASTAQSTKRNFNDGSLRTVLPYADYQPAGGDPCLSQCPRPEECRDPGESGGFFECPPIVQLSESPYEGRLFAEECFAWEAPNLWHNPLYFEDEPLERYGHYHGCLLQPFVSAGKFSAQLLALPYQMSIDPICSRRYALGYYRPGECAPKLCYQPPLNADAAAATAAFYTGMFYIFP